MAAARDTVRFNKKCSAAIDSFGLGFGAADVMRMLTPGVTGITISCDPKDCNSTPECYPLSNSIPMCANLYQWLDTPGRAGQSALHEVLHYFRYKGVTAVPDDSAAQRAILKNCYEGMEP